MSLRIQHVQRFSEQEARAKLGHQVCSLVDFYRVPQGTNGRVVDVKETEEGKFDVLVEWYLPDSSGTIHYRFAKSSYNELLSEA